MRQVEKERKKIQSPIQFVLDPGNKIPKQIAKEFKKLKKQLSGIIPSQNGMRQAEKEKKKLQSRIPFEFDPVMKIAKKNSKKIQN